MGGVSGDSVAKTSPASTVVRSFRGPWSALQKDSGIPPLPFAPFSKATLTSANAFNEPGSYKSYIAKIYGGLQVSGQEGPAGRPDIQGIDEGFGGYIRLIWQMQELPTDETAIAWNDAGVQELNTQLWGSNNQFLGAMYGRVFFQVGLVNGTRTS